MNLRRKLKHGWMLLILLAAFQVKAQEQQGPLNFSLEQSIEYALQNNADVKNAHLDKKIAKAKVGETRAIGLPQINGSVNYTVNTEVPTSFLPAEIAGGPAGAFVPVQFGQKFNADAGVQVNQLIFDGSYFVGLQAANTYKELSEKSLTRTKIETEEAVTKAYYGVLVNRERIKLLEVNFGRLDSLFKETKIMYQNGFVEKIDVDRLKVQVNNLKTQKQQFERMLVASEYLLKFQMGMPIYQEIRLTDQIDAVLVNEMIIDENGDFNYNRRIEYSLLNTNMDLARLDLKNTRVQYLPRLSAFARYGANSSSGSFSNGITKFDFSMEGDSVQTWFTSSAVGLTLQVPIFDGFMKRYQSQQKKLEIKKIENQKEQLENAIDMEVFNARIKLKNGMENLDVQSENLELAQDVFDVSKIKYQEGVGSNLEVLEAESSLQEAQTNYYNALYEALVAKVELEKATGTLDKN